MVQKTPRQNVTSTVLIYSSFLSFLWTSWVEKLQSTQKNCAKIEKEETCAHRKRAGSALSRERTLELRQWCTTIRECSVRLNKGLKLTHRKKRPHCTVTCRAQHINIRNRIQTGRCHRDLCTSNSIFCAALLLTHSAAPPPQFEHSAVSCWGWCHQRHLFHKMLTPAPKSLYLTEHARLFQMLVCAYRTWYSSNSRTSSDTALISTFSHGASSKGRQTSRAAKFITYNEVNHWVFLNCNFS